MQAFNSRRPRTSNCLIHLAILQPAAFEGGVTSDAASSREHRISINQLTCVRATICRPGEQSGLRLEAGLAALHTDRA